MSDETTNETTESKQDHEPPKGAETTATWGRGRKAIPYTATGTWTVLRKKEKPAAEIFSVSYVVGEGDRDRPVTFVFNGGPGAASAYLHMGAVGPQRVDFPSDGTLPAMPARLVENESSWLAFTDLVFVDPVGTGFSRIIEPEKKGEEKKSDEAVTFNEWLHVAVFSGPNKVSAGGTFFGSPNNPRIVRVWSQPVEIVPSGVVFMMNNKDRPGMVGHIGTLMGRYKVNIASMSLTRDQAGGQALTVLNLDSVPPPEALEEIKRDPDISNVRVVKL